MSTPETYQRAEGLLASDLGGEMVLLDQRDGVYYGLNDVGARVWGLLAEPRTSAQLTATLLAEFDVAEADLAVDLAELLGSLAARSLVQVCPGDASQGG
jgi:hypothetical protein